MMVEKLFPSGDYLISDIINNEYVKYRYSDYTLDESKELFREFVRENYDKNYEGVN